MMSVTGDTLAKERPKGRLAFISWRWLAIASVLTIAVMAAIPLANKLRGSPSERGLRALIEAFRKQRLIEPRLSGGFLAGEFTPSPGERSQIATTEFERASNLIMDALARGDASAHVPYARLLLSKSEKLPEALKHLRLALASAPENAETDNDIGVCFFQQGDFEDAIEEFEGALQHKPDMPEALFNRALCCERLLLRDAASADYARLLEIEREPGWLAEIKQRREKASSPLVTQKLRQDVVTAFDAAATGGGFEEAKRIADENFEFLLGEAVSGYSLKYLRSAVDGNTAEADRALSKIELLGTLFTATKNDSTVSDLARYFRGLPENQRAAELRLLDEYQGGEGLIRQHKSLEAAAEFERLSKVFADRGNTVREMLATNYYAGCLYAAGQLTASVAVMRRAIAAVEVRSWPYLRAQFSSQLGGACSRLGQDSAAIRYYEQAIAQSHGMPLLEAKTRQFMGNTHWRLGDLENGLASLRESSRLFLASAPSLRDLAYNYLQIADLYRIRGNHLLAPLYARQSIAFARRENNHNYAAQASAFLAVEHARLKQFDEAETELQEAMDSIKEIEQGQREYTEPLVLTRAGEMAALRGDLARAERYYSDAKDRAEKSEDNRIVAIKALRGRAEAYVQAKEFEKAHADLSQAIELIESYRAGIAERENRGAFLDASQGVFDQMILLSIRAFGQREKAFDFSEESRARILLDEFSSTGKRVREELPVSRRQARTGSSLSKPLNLVEVQNALPSDVRLLAYSVTSERTYIFLITRERVAVEESPATTEILDRLVHDYVSGIKTRAPLEELIEGGKRLYQYLIEPVEGTLNDGKLLCILPDKALHFLPFAALIEPSGRYLVNSRRLSYAPSASALVRSIEEARLKRAGANERMLAVGNPQFDHDAFPTLPDLPDAEREARDSAAFYRDHTVLNAAGATEPRVRAELMKCDVAHLAVHCVVEVKSKWLATLVLAEPGAETSEPAQGSKPVFPGAELTANDGLLYLNEVYGMSLPRTRLVILSACQSGVGQYYRGEGIVSLVRPFLAARVPTVVASLWSVDSKATADLMIRFHRERTSNGFVASDALRAAQIEMIQSPEYRHPFYWASFISVGAN